jgi:hypothetical protein
MTWEKYVAWVIFWLIVTGVVVMLICGCADGGYSSYDNVLQTSTYDHASAPLPSYEPQTVWVRTLGQPDQLVTVIPAY